jgi:hypothetical protein
MKNSNSELAMKERYPRLTFALWISLFFGIGLMISMPTFFYLRKGPEDYWMPLLLGSATGGFGAWIVFALGIRIYCRLSEACSGSQTK